MKKKFVIWLLCFIVTVVASPSLFADHDTWHDESTNVLYDAQFEIVIGECNNKRGSASVFLEATSKTGVTNGANVDLPGNWKTDGKDKHGNIVLPVYGENGTFRSHVIKLKRDGYLSNSMIGEMTISLDAYKAITKRTPWAWRARGMVLQEAIFSDGKVSCNIKITLKSSDDLIYKRGVWDPHIVPRIGKAQIAVPDGPGKEEEGWKSILSRINLPHALEGEDGALRVHWAPHGKLIADLETGKTSGPKMEQRSFTISKIIGYQQQLQNYSYYDCHLKPKYADETPLPIFSPKKWDKELHSGQRYVNVPQWGKVPGGSYPVTTSKVYDDITYGPDLTRTVEKAPKNEFTIEQLIRDNTFAGPIKDNFYVFIINWDLNSPTKFEAVDPE